MADDEVLQLPEQIQSYIENCNDDLLFSIFHQAIAEMNIRKTKEFLEVQKKLRTEKAKEVYNDTNRLQQV